MYTTIGNNRFPTLILEQFRVREIEIEVPAIRKRVQMRLDTSDPEIFRQIFIARDYDHPTPAEASVVVDAGANVGYASLWFAHRYPQARIVAIEPDRSNFRQLARNCSGMERMILVEGALWSNDGVVGLDVADADGMALPHMTRRTSPAKEGKRQVPALSVAGLMDRLKLDRIDIFKIDIEGAEREVFSGDLSWVEGVRCFIIEVHEFFSPGARKAVFDALPTERFERVVRGENIYFYRRD